MLKDNKKLITDLTIKIVELDNALEIAKLENERLEECVRIKDEEISVLTEKLNSCHRIMEKEQLYTLYGILDEAGLSHMLYE